MYLFLTKNLFFFQRFFYENLKELKTFLEKSIINEFQENSLKYIQSKFEIIKSNSLIFPFDIVKKDIIVKFFY